MAALSIEKEGGLFVLLISKRTKNVGELKAKI